MNRVQGEPQAESAYPWCRHRPSLREPVANERGAYIIITAIAITILFGLTAFGVEVGRWYAIQGELGKSIDGAAFAGAQNVNNPNIADFDQFVEDVAEANFPAGMLGTDTASFAVANDGNGKVTVTGSTNSVNFFARTLGTQFDTIQVANSGSARYRNAEIALVLDASGSMSGTPIAMLKDAAKVFVDNFADQETKSKFALINFASGVQKPFDLGHNYVSPLDTAITALYAGGWTNAEDALGQTAALPWKDQTGIPVNEQDKQAVVFFSDGNPTAFRSPFTYKGVTYDAVAAVSSSSNVSSWLYYSNLKSTRYSISTVNITGDGIEQASSACTGIGTDTVKWEVFSHATYGLNNFPDTMGIDPEQCNIGNPTPLGDYATWLVRQMAIDHAAAIKAQGIDIYTIGLGSVDQTYLETLSSGPEFSYYTTDPAELEGIFQKIANLLKLVLIH